MKVMMTAAPSYWLATLVFEGVTHGGQAQTTRHTMMRQDLLAMQKAIAKALAATEERGKPGETKEFAE